jgi:hypothetical protein
MQSLFNVVAQHSCYATIQLNKMQSYALQYAFSSRRVYIHFCVRWEIAV